MYKGVAITGMGIISSIGNTVEENFNSLQNSQVAITTIENIATVHADVIKVGEIKKSNHELVAELKLGKDNNFSRTAMIGTIAAKQAVKNAGITSINEYKTGLISATSVVKLTPLKRRMAPMEVKFSSSLKPHWAFTSSTYNLRVSLSILISARV